MTKAEILETIELRQSTLGTWLSCNLIYKFRHIDKLEPSFRYPATLHGSALHDVLETLHNGHWDDDLLEMYSNALHYQLYESDEAHIPLRWKRDKDSEIEAFKKNAVEILENYRSKDYNKEALVLFSETKFRVKILGNLFTGTVDQVRKNRDGSIELIDFKSSAMKPNRYAIINNIQLSLYAYALKFGEVLIHDSWVKPNLLVDSVGIYFLRAHEVYKRKVVGSEIGDEKGDPFYRTTKSLEDLRAFRQEIRSLLNAMLRPWYYPNIASCAFCSYTEHCVSRNDVIGGKEAMEAQALLAELNMAS